MTLEIQHLIVNWCCWPGAILMAIGFIILVIDLRNAPTINPPRPPEMDGEGQ